MKRKKMIYRTLMLHIMTVVTAVWLCNSSLIEAKVCPQVLEEKDPQPKQHRGEVEAAAAEKESPAPADCSALAKAALERSQQSRASNPIAPIGVAISEFLEFGLVHVVDFESMLVQTQEGNTGATSLFVRKFYTPKKFPGSINSASAAISAKLDLLQDMAFEDDGTIEDLDDDQDEEEINLSKLASGPQRS